MPNVDNSQDFFDSRDVVERITELKAEWDNVTGDDHTDYSLSGDDWLAGLTEEERDELVMLEQLIAEIRDVAGNSPEDGNTLVRDSYFETYAEEFADDIGAIDKNAGWPLNHIDWEAAAEALQMDYSEVDFDGVTYWVRS